LTPRQDKHPEYVGGYVISRRTVLAAAKQRANEPVLRVADLGAAADQGAIVVVPAPGG